MSCSPHRLRLFVYLYLTFHRFLDSETVSLCTHNSARSFNIHRKLLEHKCEVIYSASRKGFSETYQHKYICKDTTDGTLARFVEWAYRADYGNELKPTKTIGAKSVSSEASDGRVLETKSEEVETDNHPLFTHLRLYIFGNVYLVEDLKQIAFEKLTACLRSLENPDDLDLQLAIIDMLRLAFNELPLNDDLLDWLAQYASYNLDHLRLQTSFHDLLRTRPGLGSCMVRTLRAASEPPWRSESRKLKVPRYELEEIPQSEYEY